MVLFFQKTLFVHLIALLAKVRLIRPTLTEGMLVELLGHGYTRFHHYRFAAFSLKPYPHVSIINSDISLLTNLPDVLRNYDCSRCRIRANLAGEHLQGARLRGANLTGSILTGADLSGSIVTQANLERIDLSYAVLHHINAADASFNYGNLYETTSRGGNFSGATFLGAHTTRFFMKSCTLPHKRQHRADKDDNTISPENTPTPRTHLRRILCSALVLGVVANLSILSHTRTERLPLPFASSKSETLTNDDIEALHTAVPLVEETLHHYWHHEIPGIEPPRFRYAYRKEILPSACKEETAKVNSYCSRDTTISLFPWAFPKDLKEAGVEKGTRTLVLRLMLVSGHEYGHHIQHLQGVKRIYPDYELQADCLSGQALKATGLINPEYAPKELDSIGKLLLTMGDYRPPEENTHSFGAKRITAFLKGYEGNNSCL